MITSFEDFKNEYFAPSNNKSSYDFIDDLSFKEKQALKEEISKWDNSILKVANDVLSDYYGLFVPPSLIKEFCQNDIKLAFEIYTRGVSDTCQRSILVNTVLRKMGMRSWPTYGETNGTNVFEQFIVDLKQRSEEYGIIMLE